MDSSLMHQVTNALVARQILQAHELHQQEEQLSSQNLITMGARCVSKLWFTWSTTVRNIVIIFLWMSFMYVWIWGNYIPVYEVRTIQEFSE